MCVRGGVCVCACGLVCVAFVCSALDGSTSVGCQLSSCVHICVCGFHRQVRGLDASDISSAARTVQYVQCRTVNGIIYLF